MGKAEHPDYVSWSASYSVGIKLFDEQHKWLLDFVNDLFSHATGNEQWERAYFTEVIQNAVQYVKNHFSTEEKLLVDYGFPGYREHKKAHDEFTLEVIKSVKEFEAGKRLVLTKLARFLRNWILAHIAVMDTQYAVYFRDSGIPGAAAPGVTEADNKS